MDDIWPLIAEIVYTTAWCFSFYGQIYQNYRLKSVEGFSLNYFAFSFTGYTYYTIYLTLGRFTDIKGAGTVVIADLIFIYHTVIMIIIQLIQCITYDKGTNKLSKNTIIIISLLTLAIIVEAILGVTGAIQYREYWNPLTVLGYGKLAITFIKCSPEVYWNYKRKSTKGWSISRGAFSFASGGLSVENGLNITKVVLGFVSVIYDLIFCFQHYFLYRQKPTHKNQIAPFSESLLSSQADSPKHVMGQNKREHIQYKIDSRRENNN